MGRIAVLDLSVTIVGLDLAWGNRARTGAAVLDPDGTLRLVTSLRTDDEIVALTQPFDELLVAFDAPLVVRNSTGRRACETAISRAFGAQHAGAHSSNLSLPAFRNGARAARLAHRLGLDVDPTAVGGPRRALEVYPHPALVALFELPTTLKYKAKQGRSVEGRRAEMLRLVALLESLADHNPPLRLPDDVWQPVRAAVTAATTGAALNRIEDPVDAVVCAYVGLLFATNDPRISVVGSVHDGYIVTPTAPRHRRALSAS